MKRILIIAGPNGAGKTTFAREFLPCEGDCKEFVNADLIAAGLSPFHPEGVGMSAGRIMLGRMRELARSGIGFTIETTLSTHIYQRLIPEWQRFVYCVHLYFLRLPDADFAVRRVAHRVRLGGHHIPKETVRRRFTRGLQNLAGYLALVDAWSVYDGSQTPPALLDSGDRSSPETLKEDPLSYSVPESPRSSKALRRTPEIIGAEAALARAAERAVAEALAAGLEPVVRMDEDGMPPHPRANGSSRAISNE